MTKNDNSKMMINSEPLVSVIIPIYNVAAYLRKCLDSVVEQTYRHLEIILVDDGSPDDCPYICDEYARKDSRIKVIHKPNGGISDARNAGIDAATGYYIGFVDSDDWLAPEMYATLVACAQKHEADIAICAFYYAEGRNLSPSCDKHQEDLLLGREEALKLLFRDDLVKNYVWNRIYRRELFEGIRFPVGRKYEDIPVSYRLFDRIRTFAFVNIPLYYYRIHAASITGEFMNIGSEYDCFHFFLEQREFAVQTGLWPKAHECTVRHAVHLVNHLTLLPPSAQRDEAIAKVLDELHVCDRFGVRTVGLSYALRRYLMYHCLGGYQGVYRFFRKLFKHKRKPRPEATDEEVGQ